jgi:FkbM family methyltransferase
MIKRLARLAKDSYYVMRTAHSPSRKASLWFNLICPSHKMLGFEISFFRRSTAAYLYREIFARQNYLFRATGDSPVIFDCGANLGMATLYFKWLYPKARVEAFEPDPNTFKLLQNNVLRNRLTNVGTHNCALWDQNGSIDFFVDAADPGSLSMSTDHSRLKGERIRVPGRKLSEFVEGPIDFLKIDVEGAEHRILSDLVNSGKIKLIREMVIEYHHHIGNQRSCLAEFLQQLEQAGFEYQIQASLYPVTTKGVFQDVLIAAYQ